LKMYNEILRQGLSVRRVEELAKAWENGNEAKEPADKGPRSRYSSGDFDILKKHLSSAFQTDVKFSCDKAGRGKITFPFQNDDELERLISLFDTLKN
ncbi:MAG: chromosome partitioning protein ParB, partial [Muribaculaceae bacterium]|nr:chromosome partitioning protein ParB [Muribaculaceae bacterium]